jgi:hypothetical protein
MKFSIRMVSWYSTYIRECLLLIIVIFSNLFFFNAYASASAAGLGGGFTESRMQW